MKLKSLLLSILFLAAVPAYAIISAEELTEKDNMLNSGYSESTAELARLHKARAAGVPYIKLDEPDYYSNPAVSLIRKFFMYIDPCLDDGSFEKHNIRFTNDYRDL